MSVIPFRSFKMTDRVAIIQSIYQAFQRGDIPAILDRISDDCKWEHWPDNHGQKAGVPWLKARTGKQEIVCFFELLGTYQFKEFSVVNVMSGGNQAAGVCHVEFTMPNGKTIRDEEMHLFTFNDQGQVCAFRHLVDTAKAVAMM